jgi:putative ABC transport system permease protein
VVISGWGLALVRPLILKFVPVVGGIKVDGAALAFAGAVALVTGVAFSLIPTLQAWSTDLSVAFRGDVTRATTGRQTRRMHALLAGTQIALAFLLMVGAGLAVRTFANLLRIDPGYNPHHVLAVDLEFQGRYDDPQRVHAFREEFLTRVRHLPGVMAAATSDILPLRNFGHHSLYDIDGDRAAPPEGHDLYDCQVSADYFRTLGIPVLRGRDFREADRRDYSNRPVVMVNRALAECFWPARNSIGQRLRHRRSGEAYEVIGVVENQCYRPWQVVGRQEPLPTIYFNQDASTWWCVTVRTQGDPLALAPAVKAVIRQLDDQILISRAGPMEEDLHAVFQVQQATMLVVGVFAVFAFTLSVVGLYGVMAHSTRSRFKEIAIRIATGAKPADIVRMILRQGATIVAVGMGVGLAGVCALACVAASYVYGVAPMDGLTIGGAVLLLGIASAVACFLPACRAAGIDPMVTLRCE